MSLATADNGSEDMYTDVTKGNKTVSTVSLALSNTQKLKHKELLMSSIEKNVSNFERKNPNSNSKEDILTADHKFRESMDTSSLLGGGSLRSSSENKLLRLSLPNSGRGKRNISDFDEDESEFKIYSNTQYGDQNHGKNVEGEVDMSFRGYDHDEDSVPMMQSLSSFPTPLVSFTNNPNDQKDDWNKNDSDSIHQFYNYP